jgi:hypothetical protein
VLAYVWLIGSRDHDFPEFFMVCVAVSISGLLYTFSGLLLWRSDNKVLGMAVLFQGLAVAVAVFVSVGMWIFNPQKQLMSKPEDHLDFFIPAGFLLFVMIELAYIWVRWSKGPSIRNG